MSLLDAVNEGWGWSGLTAKKVHAISPMGHLLISDEEDCFYYLDTDGLALHALGNEQAAQTHFANEENKKLWDAPGVVEQARVTHGDPPRGSVFTYEIAAMVEGDYSTDRMCILPLEELVLVSGSLANQIKDLPDGSQIAIEIEE